MKLSINFGLFFLLSNACAFEIICDYSGNEDWYVVGKAYYCTVKNDIEGMTICNRHISQITGDHFFNYNNNDQVLGFYVKDTKMEYFPKNLFIFYNNLIAIAFHNTKMMEIHKDDLQPFGEKLQNFRISDSNIQIIEKDLFKFNRNLKVVTLFGNKIKLIDPNVFDELPLVYLFLSRNNCINPTYEGQSNIRENIIIAKVDCHPNNLQIIELFEEIQELKNKLRLMEEDKCTQIWKD